MTTPIDLADVVRQQQEELAQLRAEVETWRAQYERSRVRNVAYTNSAKEVAPLYTALDLENSAGTAFEVPGQFPFTRGIHPTGYRGKLWTMRQFAGFGTAQETNERFKFLLGRGRPGCPWPSTFPRSWATTPIMCERGRGRQVRREHLVARRHGDAVRRDPARAT
jgi:methylmalonyl-CoA mutase, N-terminal domain